MAKQKARYIDLEFASPDGLSASLIPYDVSDSIGAKIDAHDSAIAPHAGVVKTSTDQSISGIKTFTQFPLTPGSPPSTDYEISNKKYVDDKTGGNISHGDLQGLGDNDHPQYPLASGSIAQFAIREHHDLTGRGDDDHAQYLNVVRHDLLSHAPVASSIMHNSLSAIGVDDHHDKQHAINGVDHSGDLAYQQLDSMVDITGVGSANMISGAQHVHTDADGSSKVLHANLSGITTDDHHDKFDSTDHDARDHTAVAGTISLAELGSRLHSQLTSIGIDDHHAQSHTLQSHSGDLAYTQLDSIVDISGTGANNLISRADHTHTDLDGSSQVLHGNLSGISVSQHHTEFTPTQHDARDHSAVASTVSLSELGSRDHNQLTTIGANDHHSSFTQANHDALDHTPVAGTISLIELGSRLHSQLASIGVNDHHAQVHTLQSHSGDLAYSQLDSIVDLSGVGGSAQISRADHVHTDADGSTKITHSNISGIGASDHHVKFTAAEAQTAAVSDVAYGSAWNGITTVAPSKNAVYDKIEAIGGGVSLTSLNQIIISSLSVNSGSGQFDFSSYVPAGVRMVLLSFYHNSGPLVGGSRIQMQFSPTDTNVVSASPGLVIITSPSFETVRPVLMEASGWIILSAARVVNYKITPISGVTATITVQLKGYMA